MFENLGAWIIKVLEEIGEVTILTGQTLYAIFKRTFHLREVIVQMVKIGVDSLPTALIAALFVGMVFCVQIASEFIRFAAGKLVGGVMAVAVARELAPAFMAVVLAGRVGSAMAAELGTMKVTEQIDALYAMGSDPVKHLVVPRFLALTIMLPILTIFADLVAFAGGYLVAIYVIGINPVGFMDTAASFLELKDIIGGLIKALFFGMVIALASCFRGLQAEGGAKGVGEATTKSVVTSLMAVFVVNYFLSLILFKR